jgi:hypothetical protein
MDTKASLRVTLRDFVEAAAQISISDSDIVVQFQKRAHNPLLLPAEFHKKDVTVPWLGKKRVKFLFG